MKLRMIVVCILLMTTILFAQENINNNITIEDLSWMSGHWYGEAFGSECEEIWNPPSAGTMTGTFKLFKGNEVAFYEIMIISIDSTGPVMKLKHFNADLTGWEEKDDVVIFPFKAMSKNKIEFEGMSYHRHADDSLRIVVGVQKGDDKSDLHEINCILKK